MEHNTDVADTQLTHDRDRDMRLVQRVATAVQRDLGLSEDIVEFAELVQCGYLGLLQARERFDSERGTDFRMYALYHVRGAIIDGVRAMANLPRRAYQLLRMVSLAHDDDMQLG